jgi:hypothetical protein
LTGCFVSNRKKINDDNTDKQNEVGEAKKHGIKNSLP